MLTRIRRINLRNGLKNPHLRKTPDRKYKLALLVSTLSYFASVKAHRVWQCRHTEPTINPIGIENALP